MMMMMMMMMIMMRVIKLCPQTLQEADEYQDTLVWRYLCSWIWPNISFREMSVFRIPCRIIYTIHWDRRSFYITKLRFRFMVPYIVVIT